MPIEQIENLDDPAAVRLLRRVAKEKAAAGVVETDTMESGDVFGVNLEDCH
ncbi:MAG: hypothetical protein ACLFRG_14605 [Desulfococcaceae bacterium]